MGFLALSHMLARPAAEAAVARRRPSPSDELPDKRTGPSATGLLPRDCRSRETTRQAGTRGHGWLMTDSHLAWVYARLMTDSRPTECRLMTDSALTRELLVTDSAPARELLSGDS